MSAAPRMFALLAASLALAACGAGDDEVTDPVVWQQRGDAAFASAKGVGSAPERSEAYRAAAIAYRNTFRLEDPTPERADARAMLAFRTARAFSESARADPEHPLGERRAQAALLWLDQVLALKPGMRQVWFERARIYESALISVRDLEAARRAYQRYLDAFERVGSVPDSELPRLELAGRRVEELTGPDAPK